MSRSGEFTFIRWIRDRARSSPLLTVGIGDDAAGLRLPATDCLFSVDMLMEGTHFTFAPAIESRPAGPDREGRLLGSGPPLTPRQAGRKALAVNLSDLAAMAGRPWAAVVGAAFPRQRGDQFAREVHAGVQGLADEFGVALAGGDTNVWDGPFVISVAVLGQPTGSGPVCRGGARVGDWILATGSFGGSRAGRHHAFRPRVEEAVRLHECAALHAMIDVSDGLAADVCHILDESGVGAVLEAGAIPISADARAAEDGRSPLEHALGDGEDFELVFTVSAEDGRRLLAQPPIAVPLTRLGEIVPAGTRVVEDTEGGRQPLDPAGWEHSF